MALAGCCSPSIGVTWAWVYTKQQLSSSSCVRWRCSLLAVCKAVCVDNRRIVLTKVPLHTAALRLLARRWSINHPDPHSLSQTLQAVNCCFGGFFWVFFGVGWLYVILSYSMRPVFIDDAQHGVSSKNVPDWKRWLRESSSDENQCIHNIPIYPEWTRWVTFSLTWATMLHLLCKPGTSVELPKWPQI